MAHGGPATQAAILSPDAVAVVRVETSFIGSRNGGPVRNVDTGGIITSIPVLNQIFADLRPARGLGSHFAVTRGSQIAAALI